MRVFLTGATGFIGQHLVIAMAARGWQVSALVRNPDSAAGRWLVRHGASLIAGDVTDAGSIGQALQGFDCVVHNAGVYEFGVDRKTIERMRHVNVDGTGNVLEAAAAASIPRTIYVSTVWALGATGRDPEDETHAHPGKYLSEYERSKADAHEISRQWRGRGLPLIRVLPNGVIGANDHSIVGYFLRLYLLGLLPPIAWARNSVFSFVEVHALAQGICLAIERGESGQDYIFSGEPISMAELMETWSKFEGGAKHRVWLPSGLVRMSMLPMEWCLRALGVTAFMSRESVDIMSSNLNYSSAKAKRELGWSHPGKNELWGAIVRDEIALMGKRKGFLNRLKHSPEPPDS